MKNELDPLYERIAKGANKDINDIREEVNAKMEKYVGIGETGAVFSVAQKYGVSLEEQPSLSKIKDIENSTIYNLIVKIKLLKQPKTKTGSKDGRTWEYQVQLLRIIDDTGECFLNVYGENNIKKLEHSQPGDVIGLRNAIGKHWEATDDFPESDNLMLSESGFISTKPEIPDGLILPDVERIKDCQGEELSINQLESLLIESKCTNFKLKLTVDRLFEIKQDKNNNNMQAFIGRDNSGAIRVVMFKNSLIPINVNDNVEVTGTGNYSDSHGFGVSCFDKGDVK